MDLPGGGGEEGGVGEGKGAAAGTARQARPVVADGTRWP